MCVAELHLGGLITPDGIRRSRGANRARETRFLASGVRLFSMSSTAPRARKTYLRLGYGNAGCDKQSTRGTKRECLLRLPVRADPLHVPHQAGALQGRDHDAREVELTAAHAVDRRGWKRLMIVVPCLAEPERGEP